MDRHDWMSHNGASDLTIAVNVSATQLMSPGFAASVGSVLTTTETDPRLVVLEVTESVLIQDSEQALAVLDELKRIGVTLALDDFGTGYSSLNYLRRFPIDILKIDQGFVSDLGWKSASFSIVAAIVDLAHVLGMTVVAEGVENIQQLNDLDSVGCDQCQGYYLARPMSDDALETLIQEPHPDGDIYLPRSS
jgi:EAL domain-containing protein (putative c-di-GMP-specific phosphodiesterase class I)